MPTNYTGPSIVDYLNSVGQDSSFSSRSKLASQYGISGYQGTASQNTQLLNTLRNQTQSSAPISYNEPVQTTAPTQSTQNMSYVPEYNQPNMSYAPNQSLNEPVQTTAPAMTFNEPNQSLAPNQTTAPVMTYAPVGGMSSAYQLDGTPNFSTEPIQPPKPVTATTYTPPSSASTNVGSNVKTAEKPLNADEIVELSDPQAIVDRLRRNNSSLFADVNIENTDASTTDTELQDLAKLDSGTSNIYDAYFANIQKAQDEYRNLLLKSQEEQQIGTQLADLQEEANKYKQGYQLGYDNISDRVVPLEVQVGEQASLNRQYQRGMQEYIDKEANLLNRLGLAQQARQSEIDFAATGVSQLQNNLMLQMKVDEQIQNKENELFNRSMQLRQDSQNILGTIIGSFAGMTFDELDDTTKLKIQQLSAQAGIPFDLLTQGMSVVKDRLDAEALINNKPITKEFGNKFMQYNPNTGQWDVIDIDLSAGYEPLSVSDKLKLYELGLTLDANGNPVQDPLITTKEQAAEFKMNKEYGRQLEQKLNLIKEIYGEGLNKGLKGAVGSTPFDRLNADGFFGKVAQMFKPLQALDVTAEALTGDVSDFIGAVQQLIDQETLDSLVELKKAGGTLGAISEKELQILQNSATRINSWKITDKNGNVVGYDITEGKFREEVKRMFDATKEIYTALNNEANNVLQQKVDTMFPKDNGDELDNMLNMLMGFNNVGSDTNKAIETIQIGNKPIQVSNTIASRLQLADKMFYEDTGKHLQINQSYRTREQQAELYRRSLAGEIGRAAPPGKSFHETGNAVDVTNWQEAEPYLRGVGLLNYLEDDRGHFSYGEFT